MHQENHVDDTGWKYCQLSSVDIAEIQQYFQPRGEYFSKNFYFCTTPKNGPAQESSYAW